MKYQCNGENPVRRDALRVTIGGDFSDHVSQPSLVSPKELTINF